jgi:hypothetical protein
MQTSVGSISRSPAAISSNYARRQSVIGITSGLWYVSISRRATSTTRRRQTA